MNSREMNGWNDVAGRQYGQTDQIRDAASDAAMG
jgi:hypothetical protein